MDKRETLAGEEEEQGRKWAGLNYSCVGACRTSPTPLHFYMLHAHNESKMQKKTGDTKKKKVAMFWTFKF